MHQSLGINSGASQSGINQPTLTSQGDHTLQCRLIFLMLYDRTLRHKPYANVANPLIIGSDGAGVHCCMYTDMVKPETTWKKACTTEVERTLEGMAIRRLSGGSDKKANHHLSMHHHCGVFSILISDFFALEPTLHCLIDLLEANGEREALRLLNWIIWESNWITWLVDFI
jgi:hypothetical protein